MSEAVTMPRLMMMTSIASEESHARDIHLIFASAVPNRGRVRQTGRQAGRQTDRQAGRQVDRQTDRQTGRQVGR